MLQLPEDERLAYLAGPAMEALPEEIRLTVQEFVLLGIDLMRQQNRRGDRRWLTAVCAAIVVFPMTVLVVFGERIGVFAFGLSAFAGMLALAFAREELTRDQARLTRTLTAVAAAATVALVPGFLQLQIAGKGVVLVAGGAIAAFVLVYFWAPGE